MAEVIIYSRDFCPFCTRAKALFERLGQSYTEINIQRDQAQEATMLERSGGRKSVPQIFINETHVGGCDDLFALHAAGRLKPMLETL